MAYPPSYERDYSFTEFETLNPGQPKPGAALDTEFDDVSNALTATQDALALIQRDDGKLANDSVGEDQLQDDVFDGLVDGITAEAEAARDAAAASADAAAVSATAADASADAALASQNLAAGSAALAGTSQTIAQTAADEAALSAQEAATHEANAELAANETAGSVAETQAAVDLAYKWAEYLAAPVMPAPDGYPEAVDDGMWSSKWWALRARDYSGFSPVDFGSGAGDIGDAYDAWIALGNELPPGNVLAEWNGITYWLIDASNPSDPASWIRITGDTGPAGPANELTIGTVTTLPPGSPATATISGTPPAQVLNLGIPQGATGSGGTGAGGNPTALVGLTAIPGVATTLIRSDGSPALSQAIAPTWTAQHIFAGPGGGALTSSIVVNGAGGGSIMFAHPTAPANKRQWDIVAGGDGRFYFRALTDAGAAGSAWMFVTRTDAAVIDFVQFTPRVELTKARVAIGDYSALLHSNSPALGFRENSAAADNRTWSIGATGERLVFNVYNDAETVQGIWMYVERTGAVIDWVTFPAQVKFTLSGASYGAAIFLPSVQPTICYYASTAAVDAKTWDIYAAASGAFVFRAINDTNTLATTWLQVNRTGYLVDSVTFPAQVVFTKPNTLNSPSVLLNSVMPRIAFNETDAPVDRRFWSLDASGGSFIGGIEDDAHSDGRIWLQVNRTGMVVDSIALNATSVHASGMLNAIGGKLYLGNWESVTNLGDGYMRLAVDANYVNGVYSPKSIYAGTFLNSNTGVANGDGSFSLRWGPAGSTYGTCFLYGQGNGYTGLTLHDNSLYSSFMSNGSSAGLFVFLDSKWMLVRTGPTAVDCGYNLSALSFNATSSRKIKRETGKPTGAAEMLARLRPIFYRLLADDKHEQLGLIAEEVHAVCPQLSNGKTISYDRLAILLLADWQEAHGVA